MMGFLLMTALAVFLFGVPVKGSFLALSFGALLYVAATTGVGLVISSFTQTQIAALFGTAIATMVPAVLFSGMMQPVSSLQGVAALFGYGFPTSHFMTISVGTFTKALGFVELTGNFLLLGAFSLSFFAWAYTLEILLAGAGLWVVYSIQGKRVLEWRPAVGNAGSTARFSRR